MREKYESLSLVVLKDLAKARGIKGVSAMKKGDLVERMLQEDEKDKLKKAASHPAEKKEAEAQTEEKKEVYKTTEDHSSIAVKEDIANLDSGVTVSGILEVLTEGYGFIRCENYLPGEHDVYVAPSQIRRFNLKTGDIVTGNTRIKTSEKEKFSALLFVTSVNGQHPAEAQKRPSFENLTPIFPNERLRLERQGGSVAMRVVDVVSPIGKA